MTFTFRFKQKTKNREEFYRFIQSFSGCIGTKRNCTGFSCQ